MTESQHILIAKYRVVTPMFLSGADQNQAELRLPSFKGALRFWWRALAAGRFGDDLKELHNAEDALFGSTRTGASRVRMRVASCDGMNKEQAGTVLKDKGSVVGPGARYLGYGVMEAFESRKKGTKAGQLTRPCLQSGFRFTIECLCRGLENDELALLQQAFKALGLLGGLGSKSRKGYGSIALEKLTCDGSSQWEPPQTTDELVKAVKVLYAGGNDKQLPTYTAFSGLSRHIVVASSSTSSMALLDNIGQELVRYRSWGHHGKVLNGEDAERNFKHDHDLMKREPHKRETHPARIAFGLPHNYGKKTSDQIPPTHGKKDDPSRRASPLFLHIHECSDVAVAVLSFLPATFLPGGDQARINVGGTSVPLTPHPKIWAPVEAFLDRLTTGNGQKKPFDQVLEVRP